MASESDSASRFRASIHMLTSTVAAFSVAFWLALFALFGVLIVAAAGCLYWFFNWNSPPAFRSAGPTVIQLERLQHLVTSRAHVAYVLVGESKWLEGSWIVVGDALFGIDMKRAEIKDKDDERHTATIVLDPPQVMSTRVSPEKTRQWDIKSKGWIPFAGTFLGDRRTLEQQAMIEAERLIKRAASSDENIEDAKRGAEDFLREFYNNVDWNVSVQWK